jgi:hypothetical protein
MEEDEYNDIVTYIQDQKYPQNANESIKRKLGNKVKSYNMQCYPQIYFDIKFLPPYLENI